MKNGQQLPAGAVRSELAPSSASIIPESVRPVESDEQEIIDILRSLSESKIGLSTKEKKSV